MLFTLFGKKPKSQIEPIQILENSDFEIGHSSQTDWNSSSGWGGNANPTISSNRLNFTYLERTVTQTVSVENYQNYNDALLEFAVSRHSSKTDSQNVYFILINFRDNSNNIIDFYRYPESGNANTNGTDWYEISLNFSLPQGNVSNIEVRITGWETGFWAGQYGPRFNYMKLTLE